MEVDPMSDREDLKKRLKQTVMRDFGNVYLWFDRYSEHIKQPEALERVDEDALGYDCPPFTGIREMAEVVLETGFIDRDTS